MVDDADLETHLLDFMLKTFAFARTARVDDQELVVFERTETESESQFRPKLVKLRVVIPRPWILYDLAGDALVIARDGKTAGSRPTGTARETAGGTTEFEEQGVRWKRSKFPDGSFVYAPAELRVNLASPGGRAVIAPS
ncbi:MAG: hypothetical protein L3K23_04385 [Thermoplasmata archaeon]|nr:hypothetical protein [Thermoplasmata archaeon]